MTYTTPRVRLWDRDFAPLYDSHTDSRSVEQFLADKHVDEVIHYTLDFSPRGYPTREGGRLIKSADGTVDYQPAHEFLKSILWLAGPS